jgi:K+-sensing histidine kinase KdpD
VGLGLAIVKALVEAQGGSVAYEENTPRGACFRIRLLAPAG